MRSLAALAFVALIACSQTQLVVPQTLAASGARPAPSTTTAFGYVYDDPSGKPLANVPVRLAPWTGCVRTSRFERACPPDLPYRTFTNERGEFELHGVPNARYLLIVGSDDALDFVRATVHDQVSFTCGVQRLTALAVAVTLLTLCAGMRFVIDAHLVLEGYNVRLEALQDRHLPALKADCHDPALWEFTFSDSPFGDDATAKAWLRAAQEDPKMHAFAVVDTPTGATIGSTRLLEIEPAHRKLEIGWTFLAAPYWRSHVNSACKRLLMGYAFEAWNAVRVQFKAEAKNLRSRRALEGIGATSEGVLRNFRIRPDGEIRDTSFYSVIAQEWPAVRTRLERRLSARSEFQSRA